MDTALTAAQHGDLEFQNSIIIVGTYKSEVAQDIDEGTAV